MSPTFASPEWLWCLLLLPPLIGLRLWAQFRTRQGFSGLVSPRLRGELIVGAHAWAAWGIFSLRLLALAALILALARPQLGYEVADTETEGRNMILAIDTSRSMLANDLLPDRLTRAKLAAQDIVNALPEDRIGLIAFAGKAFLQAPLTLDHDAVIEAIEQLDTDIIPRGGTNLSSAVSLALETFEKSGHQASALVLFSDGENLEGLDDLDRLQDTATRLGTVLVAVGVGTEIGAILPEPDEKGKPQPGVFIQDEQGKVIRSRLDPAALQNLSRLSGGGVYINLGATASIAAIVESALQKVAAVRDTAAARRRPIERFLWPLSGSFLLMVAAFLLPGASRMIARWLAPRTETAPRQSRSSHRIGVSILAVSVLVFAGAADTARAERAVEAAGYASLENENYEAAIEAFQREIAKSHPGERLAWLNLGLGSAAYRKGDYELALKSFAKALEQPCRRSTETAHYNLGNSLYRRGEAVLKSALGGADRPDLPQVETDPDKEAIAEQWRSAIEHYEEALKINPANGAALHNLEVVRKRLDILQQPPPEQEQKPQKQEQNREQEQKQPEGNQEQEQDSQPPANQPPQDPGKQDGDPPAGTPPPENEPPSDAPPDSNQEKGSPQDPGDQPPPPPAPPSPDGDLEANPSPGESQEPDSGNSNDSEVNPETGFSPSEARQKLRAFADEDLDARPPNKPPQKDREFKNW